jgi:hypothetical protein
MISEAPARGAGHVVFSWASLAGSVHTGLVHENREYGGQQLSGDLYVCFSSALSALLGGSSRRPSPLIGWPPSI